MNFTQKVLNEHNDPRQIGGVYWNGYWGKSYTVLNIYASLGHILYFRVQWEDGTITEHCTGWDTRGDRVVYSPDSDPHYWY